MNEQLSLFDKPWVKFKQDCGLHPDFKKNSTWEVLFVEKNNYIILHQEIYYGPLRRDCEVIIWTSWYPH